MIIGPEAEQPRRSADERTTPHHILSVLVENKSGVLTRVPSLFARRGYNIYLARGQPRPRTTASRRITIVVDVESAPLEQITKQLNKLIT